MSSDKTGNKNLLFVYLCAFLLTIHYASIVYLNSSLLRQIVSDKSLSLLYILGSIGSILTLFLAPLLFKKLGSKITFLFFVAVEMFAVFGIGSNTLGLMIGFLFVIHQAAESVLYFCLDIALEEETKNEATTGGKRGIFFSVQNIAWVFSPLALTFLASRESFAPVYFLSALALLLMFAIIAIYFKNITFHDNNRSHLLLALKSLRMGGDKARIVVCQFLLNFFYAWMVIYIPLTLSTEIGFGWDKIGIILSIMLLPFLLFQLPAGFLADKKYGEKEMVGVGFVVMAVFTFIIPFISDQNFWLWALLLFATRMGASLVEIGSETFFFKHVKADDTGLISTFRMVRPLSYLLVPLITIPVILYVGYGNSFLFLALITLVGLLFLPKKDTR